ncbi:hypothetical protein MJD09_18205 [bacterium]|nr:hypothetical protein [bacterium]
MDTPSWKIFNMRGQRVGILVDQQQRAGNYKVVWDGKDSIGNSLATGVYLYKIQVLPNKVGTHPFESIKKMTFLR